MRLISPVAHFRISWLLEEYDSFPHLRRILRQLGSWNGMSNWFFMGSGRLLSEEEISSVGVHTWIKLFIR